MAQRHNGGYGEEHEGRMHEQYGGRSREPSREELRGRPEEWDRPGRRQSGRSGDDDFMRFGSHRTRFDLEREDPDRGSFAGRGYDEPGFRRKDEEREGVGSRGGSRRWESGGFRGGFGDSYDVHPGDLAAGAHGEASREGDRDFPGYHGYETGRGFGEPARGRFGGGRREPTFADRSQGWRERGRFSGRGPKGYQRSDERVREDVCDLLTADPNVDASDLTVTVKDCEVTLEGKVDDRWTKRQVEDLSESVAGVRQVHNRLQIQSGEQASGVRFRGGENDTGRG